MKIQVLIFLLFCNWFGYSQEKTADSLIYKLNHSTNDIDRAQLLNAVASAYMSSDPTKMGAFAEKALRLSKNIHYMQGCANAYLNLGNANIISGNYPQALRFFSDAKVIFEAETNGIPYLQAEKGLARAYGSMGIVFSEQSDYAKALQFHLKAVTIYEALKDAEKAASVYNNIGIVYQAQHDDFKALDYFIKAQKIQERSGDRTMGITVTNIGNCYLRLKNYDKAYAYYDKAGDFLKANPDARASGELYNNLGLYYKAIKKTGKAFEYWQLAIIKFMTIGDKFGIADTNIYSAELYFDQKEYNKAIANAEKALQLARELNIPEQIAASEKLLSNIYVSLNDYRSAFAHYTAYSQAKDILNNHENIKKTIQAEMNFELKKRDALQKKEIEKQELVFMEHSKRQTMQTLFIMFSGLLLTSIVFLIYNRIQLKKTLTLQKELAEYEQKALHLQMNPHFVFNCLGSISSFIVQNGTDSAIKYLSKFSKLMRLTLEYSKESLIPIDREIESLQNYLELEQLRFNQKFDFRISKSGDIEDDMALPPLLLQPFVENAIIHGLIPKNEPGFIGIDFSIRNDGLVCTITDNGIGFNKSQELKENLVAVHKSMALDITRKRLEMMESFTSKASRVEIEELTNSEDGATGTKAVLYLPIQYIIKPNGPKQ